MEVKRNIIFGVLNWGLGHATRSVPIIKALVNEGFNPIIASDGNALEYLKKEFPDLNTETLPSYQISYGKKNFLWQMFQLLPSIAKAILQENIILRHLVKKWNAIGVISDNRLGLHHSKIPAVYITHQLNIILPWPLSFVNSIHRLFIKKFDECWVPDFEKEPNLSGVLGHSKSKGLKVKYVGPLSRFSHLKNTFEKQYKAAFILSGPEPQRTFLENEIIEQATKMNASMILVRGTDTTSEIIEHDKLEVRNRVNSKDLIKIIEQSEVVVSRSGYSSIMDYYYLGNKALFVPTPGQSEQEYLAQKLKKEKHFYYTNQNTLNLVEDLKKANEFLGFSPQMAIIEEKKHKDLFCLFESKGKS